MEWVTPLGIPIIQPYHHDSKVSVCTALTSVPTPTCTPVARAGLMPHSPSTPILQIGGGIQSLTFCSSGDTNQ